MDHFGYKSTCGCLYSLAINAWSSQQPYQILTEVNAKLLLALVQHWLLLLGCWQQENHSFVKAAKTLRKHAFHILAALPDFTHLLRALQLILPTLARYTLQTRKARPTTFQLLGRNIPLLNAYASRFRRSLLQ